MCHFQPKFKKALVYPGWGKNSIASAHLQGRGGIVKKQHTCIQNHYATIAARLGTKHSYLLFQRESVIAIAFCLSLSNVWNYTCITYCYYISFSTYYIFQQFFSASLAQTYNMPRNSPPKRRFWISYSCQIPCRWSELIEWINLHSLQASSICFIVFLVNDASI